jgi:hypothetical protein
MADGDDGPTFGRDVSHDALDPLDPARVLTGRRLIEHEDRRAHRQHRRHRQQFAPRVPEVVRVVTGHVVKTHGHQGTFHGCRRLVRRSTEDARAEGDLVTYLAGEDLAIRVLEDDSDHGGKGGDASVHDVRISVEHPTRRRAQQTVQVAHEGRLATAVLADDGDSLAGRDREIHADERVRPVGVREADAVQPQARHAPTSAGPRPRAETAWASRTRPG